MVDSQRRRSSSLMVEVPRCSSRELTSFISSASSISHLSSFARLTAWLLRCRRSSLRLRLLCASSRRALTSSSPSQLSSERYAASSSWPSSSASSAKPASSSSASSPSTSSSSSSSSDSSSGSSTGSSPPFSEAPLALRSRESTLTSSCSSCSSSPSPLGRARRSRFRGGSAGSSLADGRGAVRTFMRPSRRAFVEPSRRTSPPEVWREVFAGEVCCSEVSGDVCCRMLAAENGLLQDACCGDVVCGEVCCGSVEVGCSAGVLLLLLPPPPPLPSGWPRDSHEASASGDFLAAVLFRKRSRSRACFLGEGCFLGVPDSGAA
mmetsp:Transcript_7233/g.21405  ORF Transcript_7233/g.21405 Transcript_7233/m.21405 type:complete len:321 (+) Transcript_7233:297-1259(+)